MDRFHTHDFMKPFLYFDGKLWLFTDADSQNPKLITTIIGPLL